MENLYKVFVYGTLKKGFNNHHIMDGSTFIDDVETRDNYTLIVNDYISLYNTPGTADRTSGELYSVSEKKLRELDYFEGCPSFYYRDEIVVIDSNGNFHNAFVYFRK